MSDVPPEGIQVQISFKYTSGNLIYTLPLRTERTWIVYLAAEMEEPYEIALAHYQLLLSAADLLVFRDRQELFVRATPVLVSLIYQLKYSMPRG